MPQPPDNVLKRIKLICLDVDGTLTDGSMIATPDGGYLKRFHAHDGFGIELARRAGIKTAIITAKDAPAVRFRARDLKIDEVLINNTAKIESFGMLKDKFGVTDAECAYVGDDWLDIPVIRACGLGAAVADARPEVKEAADYVTEAAGGYGAVREVIELILRAQGKYAVPE